MRAEGITRLRAIAETMYRKGHSEIARAICDVMEGRDAGEALQFIEEHNKACHTAVTYVCRQYSDSSTRGLQ